MTDKTLLRSQKNEVFRLLQPTGVALTKFTWVEVESNYVRDRVVSKLEHPDNVFFLFERLADDRYYGIYSPGEHERDVKIDAEDWPAQRENVAAWARYVQREFE